VRRKMTSQCARLILALALAAPLTAQGAQAAAARLTGSTVPFAADVRVIGDADPAAPVHFNVALRLRGVEELYARLDAGRRTEPDELVERFLPTQAQYDAVLEWLKAEGLTVERLSATRTMVGVTGSVARVGDALAVHFSQVQTGGKDWVAADTAPSVPAELMSTIASINGLQPYLRRHTNIIPAPRNSAFGGYTPLGLRYAYAANTLTKTGGGTTTAIIIDTVPYTSDLTGFWTQMNIPQSLSNITYIAASVTALNKLPPPSGEETLDVEMSSSLSPASKVRVYATGTLQDTAIDNGYEAIIYDIVGNQLPIRQVSISLGQCEPGTPSGQVLTDIYYHAILASLGATVLVASGDSGSSECGAGKGTYASFDSTSPYVTAVGGTHLVMNGTVVTSETAWKGSGGGVSVYFSTPSYQSGLGLPSRGVPDVAAVGDPATGVAILLNGQWKVFGGTSVATPIWAGLMGLVNQARNTAGKPSLGSLNARVYPLLKTTNFRDIKTGSNGAYGAKVGYDLVTGIGTPLMSKLLPTLVNQN